MILFSVLTQTTTEIDGGSICLGVIVIMALGTLFSLFFGYEPKDS